MPGLQDRYRGPMSSSSYSGILAAFPTPTDEGGVVSEAPLRRLVDHLIDSGCSAMVPVGGTGEFTALSRSERLRCVEITVDQTRGRVPVVAGVLSPGYAEAVEM